MSGWSSPKRAVVIVWLALLGACGSEVIADVDSWADRGCACKTTECALDVRKEFTMWVETKRGVRGSRTEKVQIEKAAKRLFTCLDKLKAADPEPEPEPRPAPMKQQPTKPKPPGPPGDRGGELDDTPAESDDGEGEGESDDGEGQ